MQVRRSNQSVSRKVKLLCRLASRQVKSLSNIDKSIFAGSFRFQKGTACFSGGLLFKERLYFGEKHIIMKEKMKIAAGIPGVELCFIKGDHFIANKRAEAFNKKVLEFLGKSFLEQ